MSAMRYANAVCDRLHAELASNRSVPEQNDFALHIMLYMHWSLFHPRRRGKGMQVQYKIYFH